MGFGFKFRRRFGLTRGQLLERFAQRRILQHTLTSTPQHQPQPPSHTRPQPDLILRLETLKSKVREKDAKVATFRSLYSAARPYFPMYYQGFLAEAVGMCADNLRSECYIALLPSSLPAAFELRRRHGGRVFCDNVENVDVQKHSAAPRWSPIALDIVNHAAYGAMMEADGLITIGNALAKTLERFGRPVHILKNFREFSEHERNSELREMCGVSDRDTLLFASGNVVIGFEPVLEALAALPDNFHLAGFVRIVPTEYKEIVDRRITDLGLTHRVHLFPFVEYERLAPIAAGADIGLITSDISNPNGAVGLPNRCFDYIAAGLPVVAPAMPDVRDLIAQFGFGTIVDRTTAEGWKAGILRVAENVGHYREKLRSARRHLTWESQEDAIYKFLGSPKSVTLIGFRDLTRYQRYKRLSRTLLKRGCQVKAAFVSMDPDLDHLVDGVSYYATNERHGVINGFSKLEKA